MADPDDKWPTAYYVGQKDHLHAIGVLSAVYNAFEDSLFELYRHKTRLIKFPDDIANHVYLGEPENKKLELLKLTFSHCEIDSNVNKLILNIITYFDWCSKARNLVAHSIHYPAIMFGNDEMLHLTKRKNKKSSEFGYVSFALDELRKFADRINTGRDQSLRLLIWLRIRDIGIANLPSAYRRYDGDPLPGTLEIPSAPVLKESPQDF